ncbi:hypothetical protein OY671_010141, partial [Metschnikowia pulcherrima]
AGKGRSLRNRLQEPVSGSPRDVQRHRLSDQHQELPGQCQQRAVRHGARLSGERGQGAHARRGGRFLDPPERSLLGLCQRRLYRCQIREVSRRAASAGTFRGHQHRDRRDRQVQRYRHDRRTGSGGQQPAVRRCLRSGAAGRIEMGFRSGCGSEPAGQGVRRRRAVLHRLRCQLSFASVVQPHA